MIMVRARARIRVIVGLCKLINTVLPAKQLTNSS